MNYLLQDIVYKLCAPRLNLLFIYQICVSKNVTHNFYCSDKASYASIILLLKWKFEKYGSKTHAKFFQLLTVKVLNAHYFSGFWRHSKEGIKIFRIFPLFHTPFTCQTQRKNGEKMSKKCQKKIGGYFKDIMLTLIVILSVCTVRHFTIQLSL